MLQCFYTVSHFSCSRFNILPLHSEKLLWRHIAATKWSKLLEKGLKRLIFDRNDVIFVENDKKCHWLAWCKQLIDFSQFLCSRIFPFCLSRISIFFSSSILFSLSVLKKARFSEKKCYLLRTVTVKCQGNARQKWTFNNLLSGNKFFLDVNIFHLFLYKLFVSLFQFWNRCLPCINQIFFPISI